MSITGDAMSRRGECSLRNKRQEQTRKEFERRNMHWWILLLFHSPEFHLNNKGLPFTINNCVRMSPVPKVAPCLVFTGQRSAGEGEGGVDWTKRKVLSNPKSHPMGIPFAVDSLFVHIVDGTVCLDGSSTN